MSTETLFLKTEQRLLLNLVLLICFAFSYNLCDKAVLKYNEEIKAEQEHLKWRANNPNARQISFGLYDLAPVMPSWYLLYLLHFFTTPLSYLLLKTQRVREFIFSTFLTVLTFLGFVSWAYDTFRFIKYEEGISWENVSFNQYILHQSTPLEFVVFIFISVLLILQISILFRFVAERFQAKIS
jgi:hypothetical protein